MIFVDSAFLLALVNPRDSLYSRAQTFSEKPFATLQQLFLISVLFVSSVVNSRFCG